MTLRSTRARATTVLAFTLLSLSTTAALADDKSGSQDEVVVTATRIPTELGKIGSSISVITAKDLENRQTRFVIDALQATPGVFIPQSGPRGTTSTFRLRGEDPQYALVLVDGMEVSDSAAPQTEFDFTSFQTGNIERIEILRGSQSVLYGGSAVGGVVNILSKRGAGSLDGALFSEWGSYATWLYGGRVMGGLAQDRVGYNVDVRYFDTGGFSAFNHRRGFPERDSSHFFASNGRFDADVTDNIDLKAVYRVTSGTASFDNFDPVFFVPVDDATAQDDVLQYSGRVSSGFHFLDGKLNGELGAAYTRNERDGFGFAAPAYFFVGDRWKYDFQGSYAFDDNNSIVLGAETKDDRMRTDATPSRVSVRTNGFYALYQTGFFDALYLTAGVRLDDNAKFGTHTSYRGTVAYDIKKTGTKLKGSYATGFRPPSLFELFGSCCGFGVIGNTALKPEKSRSWDAGVEQRLFDDTLRLEIVYFEIKTNNFVQFIDDHVNDTPNYFNISGTTRSRGVESTLAWNPIDALNFDISYTYNVVQNSRDVRLTRRPRNVVTGNLSYDFWQKRANINLNARYYSDTLDSDFDTFAPVKLGEPAIVTLGGRVKVLENTELNGRIENLFNQKYESQSGYGTAGQTFYIGVKQKF